MITGQAVGLGDKRILILGLSRKNVERLVAGEPIRVGKPHHLPEDLEILILFGETERSIMDTLLEAGAIGAETEMKVDPRL